MNIHRSPFLRHLSFFDRNKDGLITLRESLHGNLSLGLNFPVALALSIGQQLIYGNAGRLGLTVDVERVTSARTMLQHVRPDRGQSERGFSYTDLTESVRSLGIVDKIHIRGLWCLAADRQGVVSAADVLRYQGGFLLEDLEQRRRYRGENDVNVLPFLRGGPGNVTAHSWVVNKVFNVKVYQYERPRQS